MEYVAGWAHVRANNNEGALRFLQMAANSRGPSGDMVHSLSAIALHRLQRPVEAAEALERSGQALTDAVVNLVEQPDDRRPWIDLVEMVLLHREATEIVTGQVPELPSQLLETQSKTRTALGL